MPREREHHTGEHHGPEHGGPEHGEPDHHEEPEHEGDGGGGRGDGSSSTGAGPTGDGGTGTAWKTPDPPAGTGGSTEIGTHRGSYQPPTGPPGGGVAAPATVAEALVAGASAAWKDYNPGAIVIGGPPVSEPGASASLAGLLHNAYDPSDPAGLGQARRELERKLADWDGGKAELLASGGTSALEAQAQSLTNDLLRYVDGVKGSMSEDDLRTYADEVLPIVMGLAADLRTADGRDPMLVGHVWRLEAEGGGARRSDVDAARGQRLRDWVREPLAGKQVPRDLDKALTGLGKALDRMPTGAEKPSRAADRLGTVVDAFASVRDTWETARKNDALDFDTLRALEGRLDATAAFLGQTMRGAYLR